MCTALTCTALLFGCLVATRPATAQDEDLQKRINAAVQRGRENLLGRLVQQTANPPGDYPMGKVALPLAACLKAGASTDDKRVVAAFNKLQKMQLRKVYSVSCYLFALDAIALRAYKEGVEKARRGRTYVASGSSHRARGKVRDQMVKCVEWLVNARAGGMGYWDYGSIGSDGAHRHDFSNSQFAVLGLQIGLEHRIPIPRRVFEEIASIFCESQHLSGSPQDLKVTYAANLEKILKKRSRGTTVVGEASFKVKPGGWNYTAGANSSKSSMTAAGVSSLLVARNGLGAADASLRRAVEKAIVRAYAWITNNFGNFMSLGGGNHGLYTIYSLEKVGDLGDIEKFGGHNWYVEGANKLLGAQKDNGSWGSYIDTSFALLFLTRATRLKPYAAPKITTRAQGKTGEDVDRGLVYLDRLGGFVNAKEILMILGDSRDSSLVSVGREVVGNYNRSQLDDLVPELLGLWTRSNDRISRFARESLQEITGVSSSQRSDYESWVSENAALSALSKKKTVTVDEISSLLDKTRSPILKGRLVDIANRKQLYGIAGRLVEELGSTHQLYRMKINSILNLWSDRTVATPGARDKSGWKDVADDWKRWAAAESGKLVARSKVSTLLTRLENAGERQARTLIDEIAALGKDAIPELEAALERDDFSFHLIEALEKLKGRSIGLR